MKTTHPTAPKSSEELLQELHTIVADAERLLGTTLADCAQETRAGLRERLAGAQKRLADLYTETSGKIRTGAKRADQTVRAHPYETVALALGVGAWLGALLRRKETDKTP